MQLDLPQPPAKVWRALTEPELVAKWLMKTDLVPRVGHAFTFRSDPTPWWDGMVTCEVLELELHKRIRYAWRSGGIDTVVTWTLQPTASGGTHLALEHSGFRPEDAQASGGAEHGWRRMTAALRELLAGV